MSTSIGATRAACDLVASAVTMVENLTVEQLTSELSEGELALIDLREQAEREWQGAIPGSVHVPRGVLEFCADPASPVFAQDLDPDRRVVLYCASGSRSALAALTLGALGFRNVAHLGAGFESWRLAGAAVEPVRKPTIDSAPRWWVLLCATGGCAT